MRAKRNDRVCVCVFFFHFASINYSLLTKYFAHVINMRTLLRQKNVWMVRIKIKRQKCGEEEWKLVWADSMSGWPMRAMSRRRRRWGVGEGGGEKYKRNFELTEKCRCSSRKNGKYLNWWFCCGFLSMQKNERLSLSLSNAVGVRFFFFFASSTSSSLFIFFARWIAGFI